MIDSPTPRDLRYAMQLASQLAAAAHSCQINFQWMVANRSKQVTLLDFDVICAALPTVAARRAIDERNTHRHEPSDEFDQSFRSSFRRLTGPNTLRLYLKHLEDYTLPYGAVSELLTWKQQLSGSLSHRSEHFMQRLEEARHHIDPARYILNNDVGDVTDLLRSELDSLDRDLDDLSLLDHVLAKAIPVEDLVGTAQEAHSADAFRTVYSYLQARRPERSNNNFRDAINVSLLVRAFNAPTDSKRIPVLISGTRQISEFTADTRWFRPARGSSPSDLDLIQDELYLVLIQSLLAFSEGRYRIIIDEASELHRQAIELAQLYGAVIDHLEDTHALVDTGPGFEQKLLQYKLDAFQKQWLPVFDTVHASIQLDRAAYANILLRPERLLQLNSGNSEDVRRGVDELLRELHDQHDPIFETPHSLSEVGYATDEADLAKLVRVSYRVNDGTLLSETSTGTSITSSTQLEIWRDIRYILHLASVPCGAVLAVDTWLSDAASDSLSQRRLAVIWPHKASIAEIWQQGVLLISALNKDMHEPLRIRCMTSTGIAINVTEFTKPTSDEHMARELKADPAFKYFEFQVDDFTFFADVVPLEEKEMQAGIGFSQSKWGDRLVHKVAGAIASTSTMSLTASQYARMLKHVAREIRLQANRTEGTAVAAD